LLLLSDKGNPIPRLRVDDVFGLKTHLALLEFQEAKKLKSMESLARKRGRHWVDARLHLRSRRPATTVAHLGTTSREASVASKENSLPNQHNQRILEHHATPL
jgi:hypothetical protein